jgi:hypothetical protein
MVSHYEYPRIWSAIRRSLVGGACAASLAAADEALTGRRGCELGSDVRTVLYSCTAVRTSTST